MHGKKVGGDNLHGLLEMGAKREVGHRRVSAWGMRLGDWIGLEEREVEMYLLPWPEWQAGSQGITSLRLKERQKGRRIGMRWEREAHN